MKTRLGFVSNSSSSSFILDPKKFTEGQIREFIEKQIESIKIIDDTFNETVDEICTIYTINSKSYFDRVRDFNYSCNTTKIYLDEKDYKEVLVIDSTDDNSIPWGIQEALENIAIQRNHWG